MKTKKHNPKMYRACGQHVNASDDNCTDLKRHAFMESDLTPTTAQHTPTQKVIEMVQGQPYRVTVKAKRTATPWLVDSENATHELMILGPNLVPVATMEFENEANAAYIVRCVNAHEDILNTLQEICLEVRHADKLSPALESIARKARQAIAKAEGK